MTRRPVRLTLQPLDDRLVPAAVLGLTPTGSVAALSLPAGTALDPAFGPGGSVTITLPADPNGSFTSALRPVPTAGGRTLVLAQRGGQTVVERRFAAGGLDPSFGTNGRAVVSPGGGARAAGLAATADGGAVVLFGTNDFRDLPPGVGHAAVQPGMFVVKLTAAGAVDNRYGQSGTGPERVVNASFAGLDGYPTGIAVAADGRVAVVYETGGDTSRLGLVVLNPDGTRTLEKQFAAADLGLAIETFAPPAPAVALVPAAVAFAPGGGLVITGSSTAVYQYPIPLAGGVAVTGKPSDKVTGFLVKLTASGERDTGFNRFGVLTDLAGYVTGARSQVETADRVVVTADGRIAVAGTLGAPGYQTQSLSWYVSRFHPDGTRDTTIGSGDPPPGTFFIEGPTGTTGGGTLLDLAVLPGGQVVVLAQVDRTVYLPNADQLPNYEYTLTVVGQAGTTDLVTPLVFSGRTPRALTADAGGGVLVGLAEAGGYALARPAAVAGLTVGPLTDGPIVDPPLPPSTPKYFVSTDGPRVTLSRLVEGDMMIAGQPFAPFESAYTGTLNAVLADLDGDGTPELIVTPDAGGGPVVAVYRVDGTQVARFFGIDDPAFRGGARVAAGDLNGDGAADIVVTAGAGGGPRVAVFSGRGVATDRRKLVGDFFAFEPGQRGGANVAVGDLTPDGYAELVFGAGAGGGPRVTVLDGYALIAAGRRQPLYDEFAGDPAGRDGVRVQLRGRELRAAVGPTAAFKPLTTFAEPTLLGTPVA